MALTNGKGASAGPLAPVGATADEDDADVACADPGPGLGTGFTKSACQVYSTINARKMARRTRRSIQQVRLAPDTTSGGWDRVVARGTKRMTAGKTPGGQADPSHGAVTIDGLRRVVRTRGQEPAGASKVWRNKDLVASDQREAQTYAGTPLSGPGEGVVRRGFCNQLQGCSGWRRGTHVWGSRRCRIPARSCFDEKPLESVV